MENSDNEAVIKINHLSFSYFDPKTKTPKKYFAEAKKFFKRENGQEIPVSNSDSD